MHRFILPVMASFVACRSPDPAPDTGVGADTDDSAWHTADTGEDTSESSIPPSATYLPDRRPEAPVRAVFLGDSITAGFGADDGLSYPELLEVNDDAVWPDFGEEDLPSSFGDVAVVNVAIPGAVTSAVVSKQLDLVEEALGKPPYAGETVVFMTVGGNDLQYAIPRLLKEGDAAAAEILPAMEANVGTVIDFFEDPARFPDGAFVHFTNVYEPTDGVGQAGDCLGGVDIGPLLVYLEEANERFRDLAEERDVAMLDLRTAFLGHGYHSDEPDLDVYRDDDPTLWFAPDCIHPNDRGHHEVRRLFWGGLHGEVR